MKSRKRVAYGDGAVNADVVRATAFYVLADSFYRHRGRSVKRAVHDKCQ
jgi:hypothetical protein